MPCHTGVGRLSPPSAYWGYWRMISRISSLLISLAESCRMAASAAFSSSAPYRFASLTAIFFTLMVCSYRLSLRRPRTSSFACFKFMVLVQSPFAR